MSQFRFSDWRRAVGAADLAMPDRFVAFALASFAHHGNGEGARPSQVQLAELTGMKRARIRQALRALVDAGLIEEAGAHRYAGQPGSPVKAWRLLPVSGPSQVPLSKPVSGPSQVPLSQPVSGPSQDAKWSLSGSLSGPPQGPQPSRPSITINQGVDGQVTAPVGGPLTDGEIEEQDAPAAQSQTVTEDRESAWIRQLGEATGIGLQVNAGSRRVAALGLAHGWTVGAVDARVRAEHDVARLRGGGLLRAVEAVVHVRPPRDRFRTGELEALRAVPKRGSPRLAGESLDQMLVRLREA